MDRERYRVDIKRRSEDRRGGMGLMVSCTLRRPDGVLKGLWEV